MAGATVEKPFALWVAASEGRTEEVLELLATPVYTNANGMVKSNSPLHVAAKNGHGAIVRLLLERGADVSAKNILTNTPLHAAAAEGHALIVQLLLQRGADISAKKSDGFTPLHLGSSEGHEAVVQLLLVFVFS